MLTVRIKICCIQNPDEARLAIGYGADMIGLVAEMPSGPGPIDDDMIRYIAGKIPPAVMSVLLTSRTRVADIIEHHRYCRTNAIQVVDELQEGTHTELKQALPGVAIMQVIHVQDESAIAKACSIAPGVDAILLDSGDPLGKTKVLGGTGQPHDWNISRRLVRAVDKPVFLAGGLRPENVADAIRMVRPFGVDVCSGVRTNGRLDEQKLSAYVREIQAVGRPATMHGE